MVWVMPLLITKLAHGLANGVLTVEYLKSFKDQTKINKMLNLLAINSLQDLKEIFDSLFKVKLKLKEEEIKEFLVNLQKIKQSLKIIQRKLILRLLKKYTEKASNKKAKAPCF